MEFLFEHTDVDGDEFTVYESLRASCDGLRVDISPKGYEISYVADLDRPTVIELRDSLTRWLTGEVRSAPQTMDNAGILNLIKDEIERALSIRLANVRPLHQAPLVPEPDGWQPCGVDPVQVPVVSDGPILPLQGFCTCGHTKWAHEGECRAAECTCKRTRQQVRGFETVPVAVPRLMTKVRKRGACTSCGMVHEGYHVRPLCSCGHCSRQHAGAYGSGDCGVLGCECTRYAT